MSAPVETAAETIPPARRPIRIAILVFPRLTLLDFVGVYDPLRRLPLLGIDPEVSVSVTGTEEEVTDEGGVVLRPHGVYDDLRSFDLLVVPGGRGTRELVHDERLIAYLGTWGTGRPVASVCTGSLLLGRAGLLTGRRATTHRGSFELLRPYCAEVVTDSRIVDDRTVVTAQGVSSAIDLGLYLCEKYWGAAARERIATQMEYLAYHPGAV